MSIRTRQVIGVVMATIAIVYSSLAANYVYDGGVPGTGANFDLAGNWNPDGTPGAGDDVTGISLNGGKTNIVGFMYQTSTVNNFNLTGSTHDWTLRNFGGSNAALVVNGNLTKGSGLLEFRNNTTGTMSVQVQGNLTAGSGIYNFGSTNGALSSLTVNGTTTIGGATGGINSPNAVLKDLVISAGSLSIYNTTNGSGGISAASLANSGSTGILEANSLIGNATATLTLTGNTGTYSYGGRIRDHSSGAGKESVLSIVKTGGNTQIFRGDHAEGITYTGTTEVDAGALIMDGVHTGAGNYMIAADAILGGKGTIVLKDGAAVIFEDGAKFLFDAVNTLTINKADGGSAAVDFGNLSVANIVGLDGSVADGNYTLMDGTATFDFTSVQNLGIANAFDLGGGKKAYFEEGSLHLIVIPEPATIGLLGFGFGGLMLLRRHLIRR